MTVLLLKRFFLAAVIALAGVAVSIANAAQVESAPSVNPTAPAPAAAPGAYSKAIQQLLHIVTNINTKIVQGKRAEADYADELKQFDTLIAAQEKVKNDDTAQIIWMRGVLHFQVLDDPARANDFFRKVLKEFPDTQLGKQAANTVAGVERLATMRTIQKSLAVGSRFPDFSEVDVEGKPLSIGRFKGKVVLVDFWATWCGPCIMELPSVLSTYQKYRDKGFEILGISLDQDKQAMMTFAASRGMGWPQFFDGKLWENKLAQKYGVMSIPATYLLDAQGNIIAKDLRGPDLEAAVAKALAKK